MRRVAVLIGFLAMVVLLPSRAAAQAKPKPPAGGHSGSAGTTTTTSPENREELQQLRQQLQQLQHDVKAHEQLLKDAQRAHDRQAVELQQRELKRLKSEIERLDKRLRDLSHGR
jgi:TolA-binding protein